MACIRKHLNFRFQVGLQNRSLLSRVIDVYEVTLKAVVFPSYLRTNLEPPTSETLPRSANTIWIQANRITVRFAPFLCQKLIHLANLIHQVLSFLGHVSRLSVDSAKSWPRCLRGNPRSSLGNARWAYAEHSAGNVSRGFAGEPESPIWGGGCLIRPFLW